MNSKIEIKLLINKFNKKLDEIIHENLPILKEIKKYVIKSGGKRIRPLTHYFIADLLGYSGKNQIDVGAIAELIHAASLLHDDVIDNADVRRGNPTIGKLYGNKTAILAGDYLLACGIEHLNKLHNPRLLDIFTEVIRDLSVGELIQMEWEKNPDISNKEYRKIIYGKTASLFSACCSTAAVLADRDEKMISKLKEFGKIMGEVFQIKDDYIDYFQTDGESGKEPFKDFMNGLFTYPIIILRDNLKSKKEIKIINGLVSKENKTTEDIQKIQNYMIDFNIQNIILDQLKSDVMVLKLILKEFPDSEVRQLMLERIAQIVE